MRRAPAAILAACLTAGGCWFNDPGPWVWQEPDPPSPPPPEPPPTFVDVSVPDYPPLGPEGTLTVTVADDRGLDQLEFEFARRGTVALAGTTATVELAGADLGEGFGTLGLTVYDRAGAWARTEVTSLVVDLSPPQMSVADAVLRPEDELRIWVGDAWLLGAVELTLPDVTLREEFPAVYPPSFASTWDYALVRFPLTGIAEGSGTARLTAYDAAGSSATETFQLTVDGTPPEVSVLEPAAGATVSGEFLVAATAADPGGGPVWIDLRLGTVEAASLPGPTASVTVWATDLVLGPVDLEVTARDAAGNRSAPAIVPLVIAREP